MILHKNYHGLSRIALVDGFVEFSLSITYLISHFRLNAIKQGGIYM
jgi:hypothetical protein